jgi:hypothetical protein
LNHRIEFSPEQKGLYLFVKWEGYEDPTSKPRKNFIHLEAFHQYCSANKLRRFIPQGHRKYLHTTKTSSDTKSSNDDNDSQVESHFGCEVE